MAENSGLLRHASDVAEIVVLFAVYVVALTFGTVFAAVRRTLARLRATVARAFRRLVRQGPETAESEPPR